MKTTKNRMSKLEERIPANEEPQFIDWLGNQWTEEQKAEAIRKNPDCKMFWKRLSDTRPTEGWFSNRNPIAPEDETEHVPPVQTEKQPTEEPDN